MNSFAREQKKKEEVHWIQFKFLLAADEGWPAKRLALHSGNDICKLCNLNATGKLRLISHPDEAHEKPAFP